MDDRRAALLLSLLALAGASVRYLLAPRASGGGLQQTARAAARLARPLLPGDRIDMDRADVTEITRRPHVGPALAQRIVAWRSAHGPFGGVERLDSVPGIGPRLVEALRAFVSFSGAIPPPP
jgi:competence protein ComEA